MNGHQHYRMAEKLLANCKIPGADTEDGTETYPTGNDERAALAAAQVHATLAAAAATALETIDGWSRDHGDMRRIADEWFAVTAAAVKP